MADERFPLIRGRTTLRENYRSPRGGPGAEVPLPKRNPKQHQQQILAQLDAVIEAAAGRAREAGASREVIAVKPEAGFALAEASLADVKGDVRLVSVDDATGIVLLDSPSADLPHLRSKLDAYTDPQKKSKKSGLSRGAKALAPIAAIVLAGEEDLAGPRFREQAPAATEVRWFELAARGGTRRPLEEAGNSRGQILGFLTKLERPTPPEFLAPERVYFFCRLQVQQLRQLLAATDCVLEFDLAGEEVRNWLFFEDDETTTGEIGGFVAQAPAEDAPSIVLLDSGVASRHPLLELGLLQAGTVLANTSPEDHWGHGTGMSGVALYQDLGRSFDERRVRFDHWLQSIKVWQGDGRAEEREEGRQFWPAITASAVEIADSYDERPRVYAMAVTADLDDSEHATSWSQAVDQLAYNGGAGRLIAISIGNADVTLPALVAGYPALNLQQKITDPAQSHNAVTVGGYTVLSTLPPNRDYAGYRAVGTVGGLSPHACTGPVRPKRGAIKPDVVFEAGNIAFDGNVPNATVPTLCALTTNHDWVRRPLALMHGTSLATARAARFAAQLRAVYPDLRPQTIRALMVHSATWTPEMMVQFPNIDERLAAFGYGVPDFETAAECVRDRATVILEQEISNGRIEKDEQKRTHRRRTIDFFRFPVPQDVLLAEADREVELRVTLSYFAEPNTLRGREYRGLDLGWDMQGPTEEKESDFRARVNRITRDDANMKKEDLKKSFPWQIGVGRRSKGTIQSDRWKGPAAFLAGSKLLAVYPILGWWDQRKETITETMRYSLVVTVLAPGLDVYTPIKAVIEPKVEVTVRS